MKFPTEHNFPNHIKPTSVIENDIANVYFYDNLVVVEVTEGMNITIKNGLSLLLKILSTLRTKPWVYISNRVNSYSVDPNDYKYLNKIPTLQGIAIVDIKESGKASAILEQSFSKKPLKIYDSMTDAVEWANTILSKNNQI